MAELNIGYEALVSCHEKLVSEIAQDPKQMAITLFQHRFIFEDTKAIINELDRTKRDKAILLVDNIESKVKCYPEFYEKFLQILGENELLYCDLVKSLQEEYERIEAESKEDILELPSMDDGETLPDPLEHPPDDTEVGADLRAAATSRQEAPTVNTFEGRLLQFFQSGEFEQVIEILSLAESQSIDLRNVSDADGKTLLHLACRKNWVDWHGIVGSLVEKHNCDVAAVDEDGNTPLHEAYQCGNLPSVEYLLRLPTCNPDAINKHEYTVLRMALEVNDKKTVTQLLATGRVDPRKGSSCGHTYSELLAMNQLQPQPQDYDGSALQMVTQFAECMEGSNHVRQPFTSYCLRDTLHKILKNRDQVSITGIVDRIQENMLPLPANTDEIHDLLIDIQTLSNEFDIRGDYTNVFGEVQVRRKDMPLIGIPELPTIDDRGILLDPLEDPPDDTEERDPEDLRAAVTSPQETPTVDTFEGRLLQTFQSGEFEQTIELLSQAESHSIDLRGVSDADGKTLLHLACRKNWMDWKSIVRSLIEKHHCDVAAVDEDGNTPLHEACQCGNLPSIEYLLSLPSCNPDAINKYEYTGLRMALKVKDKPTVRYLLATGRVDPRKGSPRGHTYSELLAMNQLQPQPQDYDGLVLQMVIQFAECMEGSNHVRQPFTSYCLLDTLHKILSNRDQVSITAIVHHIKDKMLPLPEKTDKIYDLLIDIQTLSDEFDIRGDYTNEFGEVQIIKKGERSVPRNVEVPADSTRIEDQDTPDYYSDASDEVPFISRRQSLRCSATTTKKSAYIIFCLIGYSLFALFLTLAIREPMHYSVVGTTSVVQIHRQSVPLISGNDLSIMRLTETGADLVPITFYSLSSCSSHESFVDVKINETVTVNFGSTNKSRAVTELYLVRHTTLTVDITTDVIPTYATNHCVAFLLVFDKLDKFLSFTLSSFLVEEFYYKECIVNEQLQNMNITFDKPSYYYIGVYTDIPTEATTFSLHFLGTYLQYDISKGNAVCSINSIEILSCDFPDYINQQTCIVGSVPPAISTDTPFGVTVSSSAIANPGAAIVYYFISIISIFVVIVTSVGLCIYLCSLVTC